MPFKYECAMMLGCFKMNVPPAFNNTKIPGNHIRVAADKMLKSFHIFYLVSEKASWFLTSHYAICANYADSIYFQ